jgi:hypothetical protein
MSKQMLDPKLRFDVLGEIRKELYKKPHAKQFLELTALIQENSALHKNGQKCMHFNGKFYEYMEHHGKYPNPVNLLHRTLKQRMRAYLQDVVNLSREQDMALGYATRVLAVSDRVVDLYPLFPHTLHGVIKRFAQHFIQGEGKLDGPEISAFLLENDKYSQLMKSRMTYNLIDMS